MVATRQLHNAVIAEPIGSGRWGETDVNTFKTIARAVLDAVILGR